MTSLARVALAAFFASVSPTLALADPTVPQVLPDALLDNSPIGVWRVQITTFNCASLQANPSFESLLSFGIEGNEVETTNNPMLLPGQRSPAFGTWGFTGPKSVALTTRAYILFPSPTGPIRQGTQIIHHAIRLTNDRHFTDTATLTYLDRTGNVTLSGCATAVGERL
nr:hypothetical protein [uncultured Lichenicoccus sp.]